MHELAQDCLLAWGLIHRAPMPPTDLGEVWEIPDWLKETACIVTESDYPSC